MNDDKATKLICALMTAFVKDGWTGFWQAGAFFFGLLAKGFQVIADICGTLAKGETS